MWWCCVLFFKQKTAYEVRISDWSSDVCSSDLEDVLAVVCAGGEHLRPVDDPLVAVADGTGLAGGHIRPALGLGIAQAQPHVTAVHPRQHFVFEVGRASCRERVCQSG